MCIYEKFSMEEYTQGCGKGVDASCSFVNGVIEMVGSSDDHSRIIDKIQGRIFLVSVGVYEQAFFASDTRKGWMSDAWEKNSYISFDPSSATVSTLEKSQIRHKISELWRIKMASILVSTIRDIDTRLQSRVH